MRKFTFYAILIIIFGSLNGLFGMLLGIPAIFSPILLVLSIFLIATNKFSSQNSLGIVSKTFYLFISSWFLIGTFSMLFYFQSVDEFFNDFWKCGREYFTAILIFSSIYFYCKDRTEKELYSILFFTLILFIFITNITILDKIFNFRSHYVAGIVSEDRLIGVFSNPNETGFQANLSLALILGLYHHQKIKLWLAILGMGIACSASILSFSKMALLTTSFLILVFIIISFGKFFQLEKKKRKGKSLALLILGFVFFIIIPQFMNYYANLSPGQQKRVDATLLLVSEGKINSKTTSHRDVAVKDALYVIARNPIIGYGLNSFSRRNEFLKFSVHNFYLKLIGEAGILTLLLFLSFLFCFAYQFLTMKDGITMVGLFVILVFMANCMASHNSLGDKFSIGLLAILAAFGQKNKNVCAE